MHGNAQKGISAAVRAEKVKMANNEDFMVMVQEVDENTTELTDAKREVNNGGEIRQSYMCGVPAFEYSEEGITNPRWST